MTMYRVNLFQGRPLVQTEIFDDLLDAKDSALTAVANGRADHAEVVRPSGTVMFHFPPKRPHA